MVRAPGRLAVTRDNDARLADERMLVRDAAPGRTRRPGSAGLKVRGTWKTSAPILAVHVAHSETDWAHCATSHRADLDFLRRSARSSSPMRGLAASMTIALACLGAAPVAQNAPSAFDPDSLYRLGPDSLAQDGVPKGEIRGPFTLPSSAYPGTQHTYWVYVPAQYTASAPASLMVFNDGQAFKNPDGNIRAYNVLDNLIYRREIPVMIAVFINPGRRPDQPEPTPQNWGDRDTNRPTEYNSLDDRYARVIVDELLPALAKDYAITDDPERRGIGGASSGAIAAFTVAWERPNHFRKVLSQIGSFVNLRGGHAYADLVLQSERKPIRVFLQDGRNDNRALSATGAYNETRDWFYQNVRLADALAKKGYDVNYTWGMNRHGQAMGGAILPEMMRWLWRDHAVSTDPRDMVERSPNGASAK
jgi:enterochelin esterase family protein